MVHNRLILIHFAECKSKNYPGVVSAAINNYALFTVQEGDAQRRVIPNPRFSVAMQEPGNWFKRRFEAVAGVVFSLPVLPDVAAGSPAIPHVNRQKLADHLGQYSEGTITTVGLLLTALVAIIGYFSGPRVSLILFYQLIVAYAAWNGGRRSGAVVAVVSSVAAFVVELKGSSGSGVRYWNLGVQIGVSLFVGLLVSAVRRLTNQLELRVAERTAALEHEISDRKQTEEQLLKTMQQLRQLAENISDVFWMRNSEETRMVYVSPAYETIWGRTCKNLYPLSTGWLETVHPEDRREVAAAMLNRQAMGEYNQQYRILRPDGSQRWIRDRAFPIRDASGKVIRIVGIAEDVTDRRQLEREILEISDREQARLGQDLHDGLCQQLVSLGFDSNSLEQQLGGRALPEAAIAKKMGELLDDAITEARALARGLFPVQLETDGLSLALRQLAAGVCARTKMNCRMECPEPVFVGNNAVATHLYRIAQEAVNNAIKHSGASSILIQLKSSRNRVELKIFDDGTGISGLPPATGGMGLHIMNYRAQAIGGTLAITREGERGTRISCSAPQPSA
jgi:PAS domain S-box-containing protein